MRKFVLLFLVLILHANEDVKYVGSLLSDPPTAVPYGKFVLRNFLFFDDHRGIYRSNWERTSRLDSYNSYEIQLQTFWGLNSFFDISLASKFYFNQKGRYAYCNVGDLVAGLDFQLLEELRYFPGIKFAVRESFPLGHHHLFNLKRGEMEKTGAGCFSTQFALFLYKGYQLSCNWFLNTTAEVQVQVNSPVKVSGFHAYGGGFGTDGTVLVGNTWQMLLNMGLFYKAFGFSLDALYEHYEGSRFYGHPGVSFFGRHCDSEQPSAERVSLAPSLSYQFPSHVGIMVGSWLTLCGRNAEAFTKYVANVFYIF